MAPNKKNYSKSKPRERTLAIESIWTTKSFYPTPGNKWTSFNVYGLACGIKFRWQYWDKATFAQAVQKWDGMPLGFGHVTPEGIGWVYVQPIGWAPGKAMGRQKRQFMVYWCLFFKRCSESLLNLYGVK